VSGGSRREVFVGDKRALDLVGVEIDERDDPDVAAYLLGCLDERADIAAVIGFHRDPPFRLMERDGAAMFPPY
jgi:hypothetical protein